MRFHIQDRVGILDRDNERQIAEAGEHLCGRLGERIITLDLPFHNISQAGSADCEIVVHVAGRVQILARHRDRDALKTALTALERARVQVRRVMRRSRKVRTEDLAFAAA
jgi:hypothetical protein